MAAVRAAIRASTRLALPTHSSSALRPAACVVSAVSVQPARHSSAASGAGAGAGGSFDASAVPPPRDDRTWAAFDDPGFLGDDFSSIKPEDVGRSRSRVSAAQRAAFLERLQADGDAQMAVGEAAAPDPEAWAPGMQAVRSMPQWMLFHYAESELESDADASDVEEHKPMHRVMINLPKRDSMGRAGAYGGRKNASAYAYVRAGTGKFTVNHVPLAYYFSGMEERKMAMFPLIALEACGGFDVAVFVQGGGYMGQAGAIRNALARALAKYDPYLKPVMKRYNLLQRDNRMVERKKPGQKKARKKFQWVKR